MPEAHGKEAEPEPDKRKLRFEAARYHVWHRKNHGKTGKVTGRAEPAYCLQSSS